LKDQERHFRMAVPDGEFSFRKYNGLRLQTVHFAPLKRQKFFGGVTNTKLAAIDQPQHWRGKR
jgi:hypothetical protein